MDHEKFKAFIDERTILSAKHGIAICEAGVIEIRDGCNGVPFAGYLSNAEHGVFICNFDDVRRRAEPPHQGSFGKRSTKPIAITVDGIRYETLVDSDAVARLVQSQPARPPAAVGMMQGEAV